MNKIISIEFLRFIFMLQICLWHFDCLGGLMTNGYIAVEFYFILSGYLLYKSFCKENKKTTLDFTLNRCKRIMPRIFLAYIIFGIIYIDLITESPISAVNDVLCITASGVNGHYGILWPLWYISALIIGGGIIYSLLDYDKKLTTNIVLPVIILLSYTYILSTNDFSLENWSTINCFYLPLWRGFAAIGIGCLICKLQQMKKQSIDVKYNGILNITVLASLIISVIYIFSDFKDDVYMLIIYSIIIVSSFSHTSVLNKIFRHKIGLTLGKLSLDMFIIHPFIIRPIKYIKDRDMLNVNETIYVFIYIMLLIVTAYCFNYLYEKYLSKLIRRCIKF